MQSYFEQVQNHTLTAALHIENIKIVFYLFDSQEIETTINEQEINNPRSFSVLLSFMEAVSQLLQKQVFLDYENPNSTYEKAVIRVDVPNGIKEAMEFEEEYARFEEERDYFSL